MQVHLHFPDVASLKGKRAELNRVKRPHDDLMRDVQTLAPHRTLRDVWTIMARTGATSVLVVEDGGQLVGLVTVRDLLFEDAPDKRVGEVMTRGDQLITAPVGTSN